ncbi:LuxR C-terminal-related transcriptional regulator [Desulfonatronum thioautotrophicum]|uniref:LuxR C-terminal-related transcriptional regulator n=1 Tax=Desulfonatronum thioautotrophicum TaxID=617001 RepID=UPI00129484D3|nr:PAS domain S-box protein [Desulfonatronum thioautotrophicum]
MLFADSDGWIVGVGRGGAGGSSRERAGGMFWEVLGLPVRSLEQVLDRFPPGRVHEVHTPRGEGTFALRIIALPDCPSLSESQPRSGMLAGTSATSGPTALPATEAARAAYVIIATDNRPIVQLREVYTERIGENIQALENSIHLFGAMFDGVQDAMLLLAQDRVVHAANPQAGKLLDPRDKGLVGRLVTTLFQVEDRDAIVEKLARLKDGGRWTSRRTCLRPDGEAFPVELVLWRIDLQGFTLYHMVLRDLTAQTLLEKGLRRKRAEVEGMSLALRNVVRSTEKEKEQVREAMLREVRAAILPALERMAGEESLELRIGLKAMIEERITAFSDTGSATDPNTQADASANLLLQLTPREIEVCRLIRMGAGTQQVAELLNTSFDTIQTHRKNIRRKLGLRGRRISLSSFLQQHNFFE